MLIDFVRDHEELALIPSQASAEIADLKHALELLLVLDCGDVLAQVGVRVGLVVGKLHSFVVVLDCVDKAHRAECFLFEVKLRIEVVLLVCLEEFHLACYSWINEPVAL
jgi:hypothetical protein